MKLNNESKTLFIPLYGKALMSKSNIFIKDNKAEEIIDSIDYNFKDLKQSKWLSMYMALRASIIDDICNKYLNENTMVIHLGCGLDSRCLRVNNNYDKWYDIDFESVIELRRKFYSENDKYKMIGKSVTDLSWLDDIDTKNKNILIVAEGLTMYLSEKEIISILKGIHEKFDNVRLVFDAYTNKGVKLSNIKNPVNQMDAQIKWGMDNPDDFVKLNSNVKFIKEYIIKNNLNNSNLSKLISFIFTNIYCGRLSQSLYRIYEFEL